MKTLISPDNIWALWAFITGWAAFSIYLEQKYDWASKVSGMIIALVGALLFSNLNIIPTESVVYDNVWTYAVPLAITLLLYQCNVSKICNESGSILILFLISSVGTMIGATIGYIALNDHIPSLGHLAGVMTGTYIGGSVNLAAIASSFDIASEVISAAVVSDNLLMALYFFVLIAIPSMTLFRKLFDHPHIKEVESMDIKEGETPASSYWSAKEISLKDIALSVGSAFIIVAISSNLATYLSNTIPTSNIFLKVTNTLLGNQYLIITTLTMTCATLKPDFFGKLGGAQEIGTFLIYLFFVVIGAPASIVSIFFKSPLLLVFCLIIVSSNMIVTFLGAKMFKFNLEDAILASNACIGGPTTAAAMAVSKSWSKLIAPIMLIGTLGYVIGNYCGILIGNLFT